MGFIIHSSVKRLFWCLCNASGRVVHVQCTWFSKFSNITCLKPRWLFSIKVVCTVVPSDERLSKSSNYFISLLPRERYTDYSTRCFTCHKACDRMVCTVLLYYLCQLRYSVAWVVSLIGFCLVLKELSSMVMGPGCCDWSLKAALIKHIKPGCCPEINSKDTGRLSPFSLHTVDLADVPMCMATPIFPALPTLTSPRNVYWECYVALSTLWAFLELF